MFLTQLKNLMMKSVVYLKNFHPKIKEFNYLTKSHLNLICQIRFRATPSFNPIKYKLISKIIKLPTCENAGLRLLPILLLENHGWNREILI